MKIIEALKELPLLEKRIAKQTQQIGEYSSYASHVGPAFDTMELQKSEVQALIQSNEDLVIRYLRIKKILSETNSTVKVTIADKTLTINEWIALRNKGGLLLLATYNAMTINTAQKHLQQKQVNLADGTTVSLVRCFDEKEKNKEITDLQAILDKIPATLEMINAVTDLVSDI